MKSIKNFIEDERGWVTWLWSKMGVMIAFLVGLIIFISVYHYIIKINDADMANQVSRGLADTLVEVWSAPPGYKTVYTLPARINGHVYMAELVEYSDTKGIVIYVYKGWGDEGVKGGASFPAAVTLTGVSGVLHGELEDKVILCITNDVDDATGNTVKITFVYYKADCIGGVAGSSTGSGSGSTPESLCGNGIIDPGENCDGSVSEKCEDYGYGGGTLNCGVDCMFDYSECVGGKVGIEIIYPEPDSYTIDISKAKEFKIELRVNDGTKAIHIILSGLPETSKEGSSVQEVGNLNAKLQANDGNTYTDHKKIIADYPPITESSSISGSDTEIIPTSLGEVKLTYDKGLIIIPIEIRKITIKNDQGSSIWEKGVGGPPYEPYLTRGVNEYEYEISAYSEMNDVKIAFEGNDEEIIGHMDAGDTEIINLEFTKPDYGSNAPHVRYYGNYVYDD